LISSYLDSYPGKCVEEHVGVKAPGSEKTTTRLPLKMSVVVTSFHVKGLSPPICVCLCESVGVSQCVRAPFGARVSFEIGVRASFDTIRLF
jgi:hypothetical protein